MSNVESFQSTRLFYDDVNFPYGIKRSGDFTRIQSDLIESYGVTLHALCNGLKVPETEEESRFILVCKGVEPAESAIERAWINYLKAINRRHEYISYLGNSLEVADTLENCEESD